MNKYKKGDTVIIISGKDKGKKGKITNVYPKLQTITVEKVNVVKKHAKPTKESQGGIIETIKPINWSKARLICPHSEKPTGISFVVQKDKKKRKAKISSEIIA